MVKRLLALCLLLALPARAQDVLVEAEVTPAQSLVQAEVIYTARLLRRSSLQHGYLVMPEFPDAAIEPLGEREAVVQRDGASWRLIERRFAVFPQRSGALVLPAPVFSGRDIFVRGPERLLEVHPRPAEAGAGWWLPARAVTLREEWQPPAEAAAGQPWHRMLVIEADGLTGAQLPALPLPVLPGLRAVRLGEVVETAADDGGVRGRRTERHLLVPERGGTLALPEMRLDWWDTAAGAPRTAVLAGRTLVIAGPAPAPAPAPRVEPAPPAPAFAPAGEPRGFPLAALAVTAAALVMAWLWRRHWNRTRGLRALHRACRRGDAKAARRALVALGSTAGLRELDAALYGGRNWNGLAWWRQVRQALPTVPAKRAAAGDLPPLWDDRRPGPTA